MCTSASERREHVVGPEVCGDARLDAGDAASRRRAHHLIFFVIVVSLFPLGVGPEMNTLRLLGPGVVRVAALLASMLSLGRLFSADYADGSLEQLVLAPQPLSVLVLGKILAHW